MLDEPNSNLDEAGERALLQTLVQLKAASKTIFLIAHRASLFAVVDRILLLVNGTMQAYGPKNEVLASLQKASQQQVKAAKA
jgi:ABC-type protease/lipase transport system fused ATPase/permease subunit